MPKNLRHTEEIISVLQPFKTTIHANRPFASFTHPTCHNNHSKWTFAFMGGWCGPSRQRRNKKKVMYVCRTRYKGIRLFSGEEKKNDTPKRRLCAPTTYAMQVWLVFSSTLRRQSKEKRCLGNNEKQSKRLLCCSIRQCFFSSRCAVRGKLCRAEIVRSSSAHPGGTHATCSKISTKQETNKQRTRIKKNEK